MPSHLAKSSKSGQLLREEEVSAQLPFSCDEFHMEYLARRVAARP